MRSKILRSMISYAVIKILIHTFDKYIVQLVNVKSYYFNTYLTSKLLAIIYIFFLYIEMYL